MPDKNLTDNEIIKALECHAHRTERNLNCCGCDYIQHQDCSQRMSCDALDLINRLQAENERLKKEIENLESMQEISPEAKHFVDTKADKVISLLNELIKSQEQIKAEAYKEFAEEVNKSASQGWTKSIDDILKELVGEDNA